MKSNSLTSKSDKSVKSVDISVITAVYNGEQFIRQTIESILTQTGDFELEYIIRDGGSSDSTLKIIAEYQDDSRLTVVSKRDGGPQEAINAGMAMATGDIGCWLNADDIYAPGTLQAVVDKFRQHPKQQWLYGRCTIIDEANRETRKPITWYKNILGYFYSKNILLCENYINQPATFWRMSLWRQVNSLNPAYKAAWDYELWLKMADLSSAIHLRQYLAKFRRHDGSISENHFEQQFDEELAIAKAYGNWLHNLIHKFNVWKIKFIYRLLSR
jgi:glycosyltransferase involved in cell wall biosynthesis